MAREGFSGHDAPPSATPMHPVFIRRESNDGIPRPQHARPRSPPRRSSGGVDDDRRALFFAREERALELEELVVRVRAAHARQLRHRA